VVCGLLIMLSDDTGLGLKSSVPHLFTENSVLSIGKRSFRGKILFLTW